MCALLIKKSNFLIAQSNLALFKLRLTSIDYSLAYITLIWNHNYNDQFSKLSIIDKFKQVEQISEEQALTSSSNALPQVLISRDIPEKDKLQTDLWSGKFGPDQALKEMNHLGAEPRGI